LVPNTLFHL